MALSTGTRLGPYEIQSALGAGGMGEVYKARDTRLDRSVAIKVLAPEIAADPNLRARFEREARAVAALDHPHICGLYDVGEVDGTHFLVMPCLEGQTLAARLEKGAMPLDQALTIATQIADALDKAHRQGIVHRDLKPANIMLTKTGAKLLDFGLAKLRAPGGPIALSGMERLATTTPGTAQGTILGTVQYMAPEQVEGKDADARGDIWALGAVLYEMATGARPFQGDTPASVIGAILKDEPPLLSSRQPVAPSALDQLVSGCLAKDPDDRWQSAADVRRQLDWIAKGEGTSGQAETKTTAARPARYRPLLLATTALSLLAAAAMAPGWLAHSRGAAPGVLRLSIVPPPRATFSAPPASIVSAQVAMSPDGRFVAFTAETPGGRPGLWVRPVDSLDARMLAGTEDATYPFWSPDNRSLGFFSRGKLKTIALAGGPAATLTDAPLDSRGGTWNRQGTILFAPTATAVIYRVSATGGAVTPVTKFDTSRAESSHRFPSFLPDGRYFIYTIRSERAENWGISIASLDSLEGRVLTTGTDWSAQVVPPGHLLYLRGRTLVAQAMDLENRRLTGEAVTIADAVGTTATGYASFSASHVGSLLYAPTPGLDGELRWFTRGGAASESLGDAASFLDFELAPHERFVAVSRVDEQQNTADIWTVDLERKVWTRLTSDRANDASALWSPDGSRIAFRSNRRGVADLYQKRSSGSAAEERWLGIGNNLVVSDWSADGQYVLFTNTSSPAGSNIWFWPTSGQEKPTLIVQRPLNAMHGRFSPDGRWLAYASDESGEWQVYVQPFPESGDRRQISAAGGSEPRWRRDGRELFFLGSDMRMMSVDIPAGNALAAGVSRALFQTRVPLTGNPYRTNYAVSRDGQRFLVNTSTAEGLSSPLTILLNWPALLRR